MNCTNIWPLSAAGILTYFQVKSFCSRCRLLSKQTLVGIHVKVTLGWTWLWHSSRLHSSSSPGSRVQLGPNPADIRWKVRLRSGQVNRSWQSQVIHTCVHHLLQYFICSCLVCRYDIPILWYLLCIAQQSHQHSHILKIYFPNEASSPDTSFQVL